MLLTRQLVCATLFAAVFFALSFPTLADSKYRVLIVDGQNNHKIWPQTTQMIKGYLEETGLFSVKVATTSPIERKSGKSWGSTIKENNVSSYQPDFSKYVLVVSNYNGAPWEAKTKETFEKFVREGGAYVSVHAANNAFPNWAAYNEMIGVGGWGNRNEKSGPYIRLRDGKFVHENIPGVGGSHGTQHEFVIETQNLKHPITRGLPPKWMHAKDELYDRLRGPAKNVTVLGTAFSSKETDGSGEYEPMMMAIAYGQGRIFHTTLGHAIVSQRCVGFITMLQRGAEWAISGTVTQEVPKDFPTSTTVSLR